MVTRVINLRNIKKEYPNGIDYIYIGNKIRFHPDKYPQTKWGNPWAKDLKKYGRDKVMAMYRENVLANPELMSQLHELKDKTLGCWCKPKKCHGDILAELADRE
jgi:hypothetical protein